jgi:diaminopimelate epimerase
VTVASGITFVKGHGTENDFILLPDPDNVLELTDNRVRALTDRRRGLGADGVLRVVPTASQPEVAHLAGSARWFMDYRNADGSAAEMCGNGARLFARYLMDQGLEAGTRFELATRGGLRQVSQADGEPAVEMGPAVPVTAGVSLAVVIGNVHLPAVGVHVPNPHAVAFVEDVARAGDLLSAPRVLPDDTFPEGVNVEFVVVEGPHHVRFRVFERGVGETRSCGTGACAVAWAYRARSDFADAHLPLTVDVPGGRLSVHRDDDDRWVLSGPTRYVAEGVIDAHWWKEHA